MAIALQSIARPAPKPVRSYVHEIPVEIEELFFGCVVGAKGQMIPVGGFCHVRLAIAVYADDETDWRVVGVEIGGQEMTRAAVRGPDGALVSLSEFAPRWQVVDRARPLYAAIVEAAGQFGRSAIQSAIERFFEERRSSDPIWDRADAERDRIRGA